MAVRHTRVAVLAVVLVVGAVVASSSALASSPPVVMALGDSVTAGVGDRPEGGGYAFRVNVALQPGGSEEAADNAVPPARFVNLAEGGATSASMLREGGQLSQAVAEIRARRASPTGTDDVDVILLSVGGNDIYGPLIQACATAPTPNDPTSPCGTAVAGLPAASQLVGHNLAAILTRLRMEAGEETTVVVLTYYNPLAACQLAHLAPLAGMVLEGPDGQVATGDGFNDAIRGAAAGVPGTLVAETFESVEATHLVGGSDCLHPNPSGHQLIAEIVLGLVAEG